MPSNTKKTRCRVCGKDFDLAPMGESAVRSHMNGKKQDIDEKSVGCVSFIILNASIR